MNRFGLFAAAAIVVSPCAALAQVHHEGTWPVELKHVTIDAAHLTRTEAVTRLAKEAEWSIVTRFDDDGKTMDLHVTDQPADKVLDVILESDDFVATRDGTLITISNAKKIPAMSISSASVPAATTRGEDRLVRGGDLVVGADETVHDVAVFAGSVQIYGTATGNVTVIGGSASIKKNAHIVGSATAVGGSIDIADGAQVDGDVGVVGGSLDRHKGAKIGGAIHKNEDIRVGNSSSGSGHSLLREVSDATTRAAMLFVFGAVLFALAGLRMNALRIEAASRPMRSFALGIVGGLLGLASIAVIGITIIGLPVAAVLLLAAVFASYAGVCAVLATIGKALVGHKSDNPHVHLLVGCVLFLVSGAIPFINGLVTAAVVLTGIGVVVATRGAGTLAPSGRVDGGAVSYTEPYRT